ncbi:MAG: RNA-dependent DNA polymerase [Anaerolineales bacterium]|nr:RNA-dependent DNA polymerase [Anaerolineales bacterium]
MNPPSLPTDHLLEQIAAPENLLAAWRAVRGNVPSYRRKRARGPDGLSITDFGQDLQAQLHTVQDMLLKERYQPLPPKVFQLPKKGGGTRPISVLTVRDRVTQRAAQQVLEPLWEPTFLDCSFGFRPGVSVQQAVEVVHHFRHQGQAWVVDGDIAACFDSLDHDLLLTRFQSRVKDKRVVRLVQNWLEVGLMQAGLPFEPGDPWQDGWQSLTGVLRRSMDWALEYALEYDAPYSAPRYDRYEASRYETETYSPPRYEEGRGMEAYEDAQEETDEGRRDGLSRRLRQRAVQRMATSALLWGASFHRPLTAWAKKAVEYTFKTRAGRRLLRQSVIVSGGVAGAALVAAVASLVAQRKAGPPPTGVLQGSPLSPLLANIYLHPFDVAMQKQHFHLARFADDWVVCCPSQEQAEGAHNEAIRALARLRLKVNPAKTRIVSPKEPLEWLGVVIK